MRRSILNVFDCDAIFKKKDAVDDEMLTPIEGEEKTIKCHKFGKTLNIRGASSFEIINAQCYLIPEATKIENNIELGDSLDGQPIKIINMYSMPSGRLRKYNEVIYEIFTYN